MEWYCIKVPEISDSSADNADKDFPLENQKQKQKLKPFSVVELDELTYFAASGSSLYCLSQSTNQVLTLDLTRVSDGWKLGPPAIVSRFKPHKIILDGTWEPLPDPPYAMSFDMVTALLEPTKQILVTSFHPRHWRKYCGHDDTYNDCFFLTYNVTDRYWTKFMNPPVRNLRRGGYGDTDYDKAVAVGNTLYLVFPFDDYLLKDVLKFCILFTSVTYFDRNRNKDKRSSKYLELPEVECRYLYCVILEVSPLLEEDQDSAGFKVLDISVASTKKYLLDHDLEIMDILLLDDGAIYTSMQKKTELSNQAASVASKDDCDSGSLPLRVYSLFHLFIHALFIDDIVKYS
ncbi:hypothetical protein CMV_030794 [Castanea mollissima]|uniref:Uncharacterized protein n=1 Tax=Castanea mollissima TaxID=60419 RepID=A0A8J4Q5J2_9ROSI|nr:hypothetical protein CMV_030794 [Castanea mollissima]